MSKYVKIYCPMCGKKHKIQKVKTIEKTNYMGKNVDYTCTYYHCEKTGKDFQTDETLRKDIDSAKKAYEKAIKNEEKGENNEKNSKHQTADNSRRLAGSK